ARGLVPDERRITRPGLDRLVQPGEFGVARELGLLADSAARALFLERGIEPRPVDGDAILRGELGREVDRKPVRVVEAERQIAGQDRNAGGQLFGPSSDDPLRIWSEVGEGRLELGRAG